MALNPALNGTELPLLLFALVPIGTALILILVESLLKPSRIRRDIVHVIAFIGALLDISLAYFVGYKMLEDFNGDISKYRDVTFLVLEADGTSVFFMMIFTTVHFAISIYCINFMEQFEELPRFYALLLSVIGGLNLIVLATDYFTLFVAYEAMALCAYAMVGFYRDREASEAGFKYMMMSSAGSLMMLYGIALLYGVTGSIKFIDLEQATPQNNMMLTIAILMMVSGFGVKASFLFFNQWLPDAHPAAPPPAHAMLSGLIVIAGTYGILRTFNLVIPLDLSANGDWSTILIFLGIFTSLQGNLFVLIQFKRSDPQARNLKRIFAFSTIAHMGYLITGIGTANEMGFAGVLMHALNHAVAKGIVFCITGYLIIATGTYYLDHYKGLGRRDPLIGTCLVIGLFSLASIPLTGGFWSKLYIILALFENPDRDIAMIAGLSTLIITILAAAGYLWIIKYVIMDKSDMDEKYIIRFDERNKLKNSWSMKIAIIFLTVIALILGLFPGWFIDLSFEAANTLLS
ncbi:MAG: complex I subunit 5 family protein [Candidatus Hodarchaeales archaeon]|jgi:proton-translocating NADH-quinone oxidoreductase chain N